MPGSPSSSGDAEPQAHRSRAFSSLTGQRPPHWSDGATQAPARIPREPTYDFDDDWEHDVLVDAVSANPEGVRVYWGRSFGSARGLRRGARVREATRDPPRPESFRAPGSENLGRAALRPREVRHGRGEREAGRAVEAPAAPDGVTELHSVGSSGRCSFRRGYGSGIIRSRVIIGHAPTGQAPSAPVRPAAV